MTIELGPNRYGKSAIRLVKVIRDGPRHAVRDLTVDIALEGDFAAAHTADDNAHVVATDTMKNTVYALAPKHLTGSIERFGLVLARHHLGPAQVRRARVTIGEHEWRRMSTSDGPADDAFVRAGDMTRTTQVTVDRAAGVSVASGIEDLVVMKTTRSAFAGFPRDEYTTLPETDDRIMATRVTADWRYSAATARDDTFDYDAAFDAVRGTLLDVMATHHSASVQASIWIIGKAILEAHASVDEVHMQLPNLHHWLVDLAPFGLPNEREIFVATTQPHGLIDATVRRGA
jgi:urate oxidase